MSDKPNKTVVLLLELLNQVRLWWWTIIAGLALGASAGIIVYHHSPKIYAAETKILVRPPQISDDFVRTTVDDDMSLRLQSLKESVLSRPYLTQIVEDVLGEPDGPEELERLIRQLRRKLQVRVGKITKTTGTGQFSLRYSDENPELAAKLVNSLAQLYIDENARIKESQASDVVDTFARLAEEVASEKREMDRKLQAFKAKHYYELPSQREANMQELQHARDDLTYARQNLRNVEGELDLKRAAREQERKNAVERLQLEGVNERSPVEAQYSKLLAELDDAERRYTPDHPVVTRKRSEVQAFVAKYGLDSPKPNSTDGGEGDVPLTRLDFEIAGLEREQTSLIERIARLETKISEVEARRVAEPRVAQELSSLEEGYAQMNARLNELLSNREAAEGALSVERDSKGERFEFLERAAPPALPTEPDAKMILAMCVAAGLALFVGPLYIRQLLNPTINSESGLRVMDEAPFLLSISEIKTKAVAKSQKRRWVLNLGVSAASLAALVSVLSNYTDLFSGG